MNDHLTQAEKLLLAASPYPSTAALLDDALLAVLDEQLAGRAPFTQAEFEALRVEVSAGLMDALFGLVAQVAKVIDASRVADRAISAAASIAFMSPLADARAQLGALVFPGFVRSAGAAAPAPHARLPRRHHPPRRAPRREPRPRPPVADRDRAGDAALPRRRGHAAARARRRTAPRPGALDAGGAAAVPLRPAPRRRRPGERAADPQGARAASGLPDPVLAPTAGAACPSP